MDYLFAYVAIFPDILFASLPAKRTNYFVREHL